MTGIKHWKIKVENVLVGLELPELFYVETTVSDVAVEKKKSVSEILCFKKKHFTFSLLLLVVFACQTSHKLASLCSDKMATDQLSFQPETTRAPGAIGQQK